MSSEFMNSRIMRRLSAYLQQDLDALGFNGSYLREAAKSGARIFLWWSVPAGLFVYCVRRFKENVPIKYLELAINEGIGPHLWNVIGSLGLVLFGLLLLFPKSRFLASSTHQVLGNTFAIGGLTFGLVIGRLIFGLANESINVEAWRLWLAGVGSFVLTLQVILLNFSLWLLGCLARPDEKGERNILTNVARVRWPLRVFLFCILTATPVITLMLKA